MKFCAAAAKSLSALTRRIVECAKPTPHLEAEFEGLTERLNAALAELERRNA